MGPAIAGGGGAVDLPEEQRNFIKLEKGKRKLFTQVMKIPNLN